MPVAPGRNIAILVEVAARNQLLRARGHHAARLLAAAAERGAAAPERPSLDRHGRRRGRAKTEDSSEAARRAAQRERTGTAGGSRSSSSPGCRAPGKSQAIRALEDLGYFCVDNLPTALIPTLAQLAVRGGVRKGRDRRRRAGAAFPVHVPGDLPQAAEDAPPEPGADLPRGHATSRSSGVSARHGVRIRWAAASRSSRASAKSGRGMAGIRAMADEIVDTSDMTVHELRQFFMGLSRDRVRAPLVVTLLSFGFKHGVPVDADLMFDVRCLPNPHFVPTLRRRTGRDRAVVRVHGARAVDPRVHRQARRVRAVRAAALRRSEGKSYLTIAIGCTGGRHRSVMIAERLRDALAHVTGHAASASSTGTSGGARHDRRRRRDARPARRRTGERRGNDRRRPAAVHGGVDRLARGRERRARRHRAGDRAGARRFGRAAS